jgi:hypothetical protein
MHPSIFVRSQNYGIARVLGGKTVGGTKHMEYWNGSDVMYFYLTYIYSNTGNKSK